ncbi:hypothetical protein RhiirA5_381914 [Rhizophagus irregularis]|uniref:Uncharacterized protein n=1 Tax=Rhizophagus irregularis TaxID=588596 RepID=A0A2N0P308_9GLOM|nr:hypothetical protein RhiirA5_381914 [Rhizophagus irregularis]
MPRPHPLYGSEKDELKGENAELKNENAKLKWIIEKNVRRDAENAKHKNLNTELPDDWNGTIIDFEEDILIDQDNVLEEQVKPLVLVAQAEVIPPARKNWMPR